MAWKYSKNDEKQLLMNLLEALQASKDNLCLDSCDAWHITPSGAKGYDGACIQTDGESWYVFAMARSKRHWSSMKRKLSFMRLVNDGDDEGRFALARMPTAEEAEAVREVIGLHKRHRLSDEVR